MWKDLIPLIQKEELGKLVMELINISSPTGKEKEKAEYIYNRLKANKRLKVYKQEVEPDRHNVIATLKGTGDGSTFLFVCHIDTAFGGDEEGVKDLGVGYQPVAHRDGDWIYGLGAYNMINGLASIIHLMELLADSKIELKGDVSACFVVGETVHVTVPDMYDNSPRYRGLGVGSYSLLRHGVTGDVAVVPEATSGRISIASGGILYFQITTWGNPGATYFRGSQGIEVKPAIDAIEKMDKIAEAIKAWIPRYRERNLYMGEKATNAAIIAIQGGLAFRPSKVPPICKLFLEVDTMPGQHNQDVVKEVEALVESVRKNDPDMKVEIRTLCSVAGSEISKDEYIVKALEKYHEEVMGAKPPITFDSWYADPTALTRAGIPALCYGTVGSMRGGGSGYYAKEGEHCSLEEIFQGVKVYLAAVVDVCSMTRDEYKKLQPKDRGTVVY